MASTGHPLPEEPDPNEVAEDFGVDPAEERAGEHPGRRSSQPERPEEGEPGRP